MKWLRFFTLGLLSTGVYAETNANSASQSILKKVRKPQLIDYENDCEGVLDLFRDNVNSLVAVPEGYQLTAADINKRVARVENSIKTKEPLLPESKNKIIPKTFRLAVLKSGKGKVTGFINYWLHNDASSYIQLIAVKKTRRNRGYGNRLMKYALEELEDMGACTVTLHADDKNERVQNFYKELGFKIEPEARPYPGSVFMRYNSKKPACKLLKYLDSGAGF